MRKIPKRIWTASLLCLLAAAIIVYLGVTFTAMWQDQPIYPQVTPYLTGHTIQSGCSTQAADSPGNRDKIPSFFFFVALSILPFLCYPIPSSY